MVEISKKLAEELLDNTRELLSENEPMKNYSRYAKRCARYEKEIAELESAIKDYICPANHNFLIAAGESHCDICGEKLQ